MSPEERYKITSSDYADFIIEGNNRINEIAGNPEYSVLALEDNYAVAYLPSEYMDFNSVRVFGYDAIPKIYGLLSYVSLESSGITQLRGEPGFDLEGEGVLIGFIDTGIDYISQAFRNADQSTRIVSIWDQTLDTGAYPENFYYGTEFNQEQINSALQNRNPLSVVPTNDENGHGTMLAGVAAGTVMEENGFAGVAPKSELVVVKLKQAKPYLKEFFRVPQNSVSFQSNDILMGVSYLNQLAARLNRPLVICLGVGTNQGDHEGRCPMLST